MKTTPKKILFSGLTASFLLLAPSGCEENANKKTGEENANKKTVVEIAASNDSFTTLVAAVKAADLAETLSGTGPFTIFAPTNEAFANLPEGTVEMLPSTPSGSRPARTKQSFRLFLPTMSSAARSWLPTLSRAR